MVSDMQYVSADAGKYIQVAEFMDDKPITLANLHWPN